MIIDGDSTKKLKRRLNSPGRQNVSTYPVVASILLLGDVDRV